MCLPLFVCLLVVLLKKVMSFREVLERVDVGTTNSQLDFSDDNLI